MLEQNIISHNTFVLYFKFIIQILSDNSVEIEKFDMIKRLLVLHTLKSELTPTLKLSNKNDLDFF